MATVMKRKPKPGSRKTRPYSSKGKVVSAVKINITGGNKAQREAIAWLIHDYLYHSMDLKCRNMDAEEELDVQHPQRLALGRLSGVQIDVCQER